MNDNLYYDFMDNFTKYYYLRKWGHPLIVKIIPKVSYESIIFRGRDNQIVTK